MYDDTATARAIAARDAAHPWSREGSLPHTREDLIAEGIALLALLFSVAIGIVIAMLPVSTAEAMPSVRTAAHAGIADRSTYVPLAPPAVPAPVARAQADAQADAS